jgi:hypothetical protein
MEDMYHHCDCRFEKRVPSKTGDMLLAISGQQWGKAAVELALPT